MVEAGRDPIEEAAAEATRMTVAQLVDRYLSAIEKTHRDHRKVRRSIERDVLPVIGARAAEDIRRRDIIAILDTIAERGAPVHANRVRNMLSAMWTWAISEDLPGIENNPASNVKSRIVEQPGTRWLSAAEIRAVAPHLDALPAAKRDALWLILLTGQRPGEVVGMRAGRSRSRSRHVDHSCCTVKEQTLAHRAACGRGSRDRGPTDGRCTTRRA